MINYKAKKRKQKKGNCSFYKSETNLHKMRCGLMWCVGQCWEKYHNIYIKKDIWMSLQTLHVFINDIRRYIATFCDLKKRTKSCFIS